MTGPAGVRNGSNLDAASLGGKRTKGALALASMLTSIAFAALAMAPITDRDPDILFSKSQTFDARLDTVEIWLEPNWILGELSAPSYVMRRTVSYRADLNLVGQTVFWASETDCPPGLAVLERLNKLQAPTILVPELTPDYAITVRADGASYRLRTEGYYPTEPGKIDLTFGMDTPIANWIDDSFRSLSSCWREKRPEGR